MASTTTTFPTMVKVTLKHPIFGLEQDLFAPRNVYDRIMEDGEIAAAILQRMQEMYPEVVEEGRPLSVQQSMTALASLGLLQGNEGENSVNTPASQTGVASENTQREECGEEDIDKDNEDRTVWSHEATLHLLDEWRKHQTSFVRGKSSQKKIWGRIAQALHTKGHTYSGEECSRKLRNMKNSYKRTKDSQKKTGGGRKTWKYFQQMEEIFSQDPSVSTIGVVASMPFASDRDDHQSNSMEQDSSSNESPPVPDIPSTPPSTSHATTPCRRRRQSLPPNEPAWVGKMMTTWERMHREKMEMEERKIKALEALAQHLKK